MTRFFARLSLLFVTTAAWGQTIDVHPATVELNGIHDRVQLQISDRSIDATRTVRFENRSPEFLTVSPTGRVAPLKNGKGAIRIHSADNSVDVVVTTPLGQSLASTSWPEA